MNTCKNFILQMIRERFKQISMLKHWAGIDFGESIFSLALASHAP